MSAKKIRILLVVRSATQRARARSLLASAPCVEVVDAVDTGSAALHAVDRRKVDLVLVDLLMPGMSGLETTFRLKAHRSPPLVGLFTLGAGQVYELAAAEVRADGLVRRDRLAEDLHRLLARLFPVALEQLAPILAEPGPALAPAAVGAGGAAPVERAVAVAGAQGGAAAAGPSSRPCSPVRRAGEACPTAVVGPPQGGAAEVAIHLPSAVARSASWIGFVR